MNRKNEISQIFAKMNAMPISEKCNQFPVKIKAHIYLPCNCGCESNAFHMTKDSTFEIITLHLN